LWSANPTELLKPASDRRTCMKAATPVIGARNVVAKDPDLSHLESGSREKASGRQKSNRLFSDSCGEPTRALCAIRRPIIFSTQYGRHQKWRQSQKDFLNGP
jgi:hypothetical protein